MLVALQLLQASTHCNDISKEQTEISESLDKTKKDRTECLQELKQLEAQLRKLENSHSDRFRQINRLRQHILTFKSDSIHKQKQVENAKMSIDQKKSILIRLEKENQANVKRKEECSKLIKNA